MIRVFSWPVQPLSGSFAFWGSGCAQQAVDLWDAAEALKEDVARIKPLNAA
jgi:hypothetical protein